MTEDNIKANESFRSLSKIIIFIFVILLVFIAIGDYSLWGDEGSTAYFASQSSFGDLVQQFLKWRKSEAQMPGYVAYIWAWAKILGHSEIALRYSNIPFLIWFYLTLIHSRLSKSNKITIILLTVLNPFIWYNLNEARNTIILFSLAFIILISLYDYFNYGINKSKINIIVISFLIGISFNLLFFFYSITIVVLFLTFNKRGQLSSSIIYRNLKYHIAVISVFSILILSYNLIALSHGSNVDRVNPGLLNIAEVFYEFAGFIGLGPPRNEIRNHFSAGIFFEYKYTLIPYSVLLLACVGGIFILLAKKKKLSFLFNGNLLAFVVSLLLFYSAAVIAQFRFWARHVVFLYPVFILYIVLLFDSILVKEYKKYFLSSFAVFLIFWIYSDFQLRFNPEYQKENYKLAVNEVLEMDSVNNLKVYWGGDKITSSYYGLFFNDSDNPQSWPKKLKVYSTKELPQDNNITKDKNVIVLFKRYDSFDPNGLVRNYISNHNYYKRLETKDFLIFRSN